MKKLFATIVSSCLMISGCATMPTEIDVQKSKPYEMSKDAVWERVVQYFADRNIPIKTIEKESGIIYAERSISFNAFDLRERASFRELADCGSPGIMATPLAHLTDMNVFVRPTSPTTSVVTINVRFHESRRVVSGGGWTADVMNSPCASTGHLEKEILDFIVAK